MTNTLRITCILLGLLLAFGSGGGVLTPDGPRQAVIVHETNGNDWRFDLMLTNLRNKPHSEYLESKGHTLEVVDQDSWPEKFEKLPVLLIYDGDKELNRGPSPGNAVGFIEELKRHGG